MKKLRTILPIAALLVACGFFLGCASVSPQQKYANTSTSQLQLRRLQLHEEIPDMIIKFGIFGKDYEDEKKEKQVIEMELLRRFEAGDKTAELKPLPPKTGPTLRGGR